MYNLHIGNYAPTGGAFYCSSGMLTIANNIIAYNSSMLYKLDGTVSVICNDIYENCDDYQGNSQSSSQISGNISVDPQMTSWFTGDIHIQPSSPCVDSGNPNYVVIGTTDIDGQTRVMDGNNDSISTADIGADEVADSVIEQITLTPATSSNIPPSSFVTLTVNVSNRYSHQPLSGYRVDFTVSAGSIASISPDGYLSTPALSGWGTTDTSGNVTITVLTPSTTQAVMVTSSTSTCDKVIMAEATINRLPVRVGFLFNLCNVNSKVAPCICEYLNLIENEYKDIIHERISDISSGIDSSFNVIFIALPNRVVTTSELNALNSFVQSGRNKRIVLVGEYSSSFAADNTKLNTVASTLGMDTCFYTGSRVYDDQFDRNRLCSINSAHYLTSGVTYLWDAASDTFVTGWEAYAHPIAYLNSNSMWPWILEEDTTSAGSRIAMHDTCIMLSQYNCFYDFNHNGNDRFIHNLCTIFPQ